MGPWSHSAIGIYREISTYEYIRLNQRRGCLAASLSTTTCTVIHNLLISGSVMGASMILLQRFMRFPRFCVPLPLACDILLQLHIFTKPYQGAGSKHAVPEVMWRWLHRAKGLNRSRGTEDLPPVYVFTKHVGDEVYPRIYLGKGAGNIEE